MDFGVVTPSEEEMIFLKDYLKLEDSHIISRNGFFYTVGTIDTGHAGDTVKTIISGVGKVNTACATQYLIDEGIQGMIMFGVSGAVDDIPHGTVVVPETITYHDADMELISEYFPFREHFSPDPKLLEDVKILSEKLKDSADIRFVSSATGDMFITDDTGIQRVRDSGAGTVDMESAAFAHVCFRNNIPFIVIRAVSNQADTEDKDIDIYTSDEARAAAMLVAALLWNQRDWQPRTVLDIPGFNQFDLDISKADTTKQEE